jgi:hypothetical protein
MELNAYVLAMAITGVARLQEDRQAVSEPEFKPLDLGYLRNLAVDSNQPRSSDRNGKSQSDISEALPA